MKVWLPAIKGESGMDVLTRRLAQALERRGITAEITWFATHYQFAPFLLRKVSPPPSTDIVHALSWSGFAFKRKQIPLVVSEQLHVLDPAYKPYKSFAQRAYHEILIRKFMNASFREASAITAVSRLTAEGIKKSFGQPSITVIPNWIDTENFYPRKDERRGSTGPFRLLFVGNLTRRKGADLLVPLLRGLGDGFELRFTSGLRNMRLAGASRNMIPLGQITSDNELVRVYSQCHALLFPSRHEGLPIAPLEAMACGKPVIAANTSSLPEVVEDGVTGILCPPDDVDAFVTACRRLAENPELRMEYGRAARQRVEERFSEERIIPQYIELYRNLVEG